MKSLFRSLLFSVLIGCSFFKYIFNLHKCIFSTILHLKQRKGGGGLSKKKKKITKIVVLLSESILIYMHIIY